MTRAEFNRLEVGDRLVLSDDGKQKGILRRSKKRAGYALYVLREAGLITVQRDGVKYPSAYAFNFWDLEDQHG